MKPPAYTWMIAFMVVITGTLMFRWSQSSAQTNSQEVANPTLEKHQNGGLERNADVPELPFDDNPDPLLCGIPEPWGENKAAWLTGYYQGELIQEEVLLYDSHLRRSVVGRAPSGTEIEIKLYQVNPSLNYYFVRTLKTKTPQEGWIPAPFVNFEAP